ncbi:siderophore-iron reductase FhuF [Stutzerimonas stutzeri]|uniref:siderophore-iron reductase FhuF n=1 Tax=Stutzerimonas sp. S1 TaxID=3030652 RepID=UPI0022244574|nr:siderophore-iron reductase FhuF [Stutzerimonas sp. S1]MCW3148499.1 siderophore-iron reductase FhuF [Stutzerimonas sp. S1]
MQATKTQTGAGTAAEQPVAGGIAALADLYVGEFAHYRDVLVLADDPRDALPLVELLLPRTLDEQLLRFRPQAVGEDRRALVSHWSRHYFVRLIPPVVAAATLLDRRLPLRLEQLAVVLDDQGQPSAFKLLNDGERFAESSGPFGRFEHLIEDNLAPFIEALGRYAGVAPKVLWSNAGNYFEAVFGQLASRASQAQLADGRALVDARYLPDGRRNPLYRPVRYVELENADGRSRIWRQRRLCCIRYLLDGVALCPNCPRLDAPPQ